VREGEAGGSLTVIGEECHIVSPAGLGPRAGQPVDDVDGYDNLILLCPNDHRLIDTLIGDYPVERLREIKRSHEDWVRTTLERSAGVTAITIVRGEPTFLRYLGSAREVLGVAASAEELSLDCEDPRSENDTDLVAGFLQRVYDETEMWDEYEPADRVRCTFDLDREMKALEEHGWRVFGARVRGRLTSGVPVADTPWDTAYIRLVRADSASIIRLNPEDASSIETASL